MSAQPILYHESNGWITHASSTCPLPSDAVIIAQFRCGKISRYEHKAGNLNWRQRDLPFDIKAYRIIEMPAEAE